MGHDGQSNPSQAEMGWVTRSAQTRSSRQGEALPALFFRQPNCLVKRSVVAQRGAANTRELVGQGPGGLVVVASAWHIQRLVADAADLLARALCHLGCQQHAARAVREQHSQVAVALLGDAVQVAAR